MPEFYSFAAGAVQALALLNFPPDPPRFYYKYEIASRKLRRLSSPANLDDCSKKCGWRFSGKGSTAMQMIVAKASQSRFVRFCSATRVAGLYLALALTLSGCSSQRTPLQVSVTQLAPYVSAAKDPSCAIPVLHEMPMGTYSQVAIVEAWADLKDTEEDVLPALRRKACETGADALIILNSKHQDIKQLLYQASPNEQLNDTTKQNVYAGQGEYIQQMEHTRRIGEAGHNGLYIDAVAITYDQSEKKRSSSGTEAASPRSNNSAHPQG